MKKIALIIFLCVGTTYSFAQNEEDVLRYTMTNFGGSARNISLAGAMTALGGDFSVATSNPAGIGKMTKDNFSATLNVELLNAESTFYGAVKNESGSTANLSNLSYVKAYNLDPKKFNNWYGVQLGMGLNRINSFQERINYGGVADSSILHSFIAEANGTPDSLLLDAYPFSSGLAYYAYGIDTPPGGDEYTTSFNSGQSVHDRQITRTGGMTEYNFTLSGNYGNKLLIGGGLTFIKSNFSERFQHVETFTDDSIFLNSINYTGELDIEGWGYSARLGVIYMPFDYLRVGLGAQLPTVFNLNDRWTNNMTADTKDGPKTVDPSYVYVGRYDYRVRTPFRANGSIGLILKKFGSIGLEVEMVDYSNSILKTNKKSQDRYSFTAENFQIENLYRSVFNVKLGMEIRLNPQAYLRGGAAYYPSPYQSNKVANAAPTYFYTLGLGYNWGNVFIDMAYALKLHKMDYYAYDPTLNGSYANIDLSNSQVLFTLGFRFDSE